MEQTIIDIHTNTWHWSHWVQAIYGWVIVQGFVIRRNKKEIDKNSDGIIDRYEFREYLVLKMWAIIFSFGCIPLGIAWLPWLWVHIAPDGIPWSDYAYPLAGMASYGLEQILHKLFKQI